MRMDGVRDAETEQQHHYRAGEVDGLVHHEVTGAKNEPKQQLLVQSPQMHA